MPNGGARRPLWLMGGSVTAMVTYLFVIGPGNMFPIVIVMGLIILVPATASGGYVGMALRKLACRYRP